VLNFKWAIIAAAAAFLISTALGIFFKVSFLYIILRAIVFTFLFFGFGFALRFLINSFFPELLVINEESETQYSMEQSPSRESAVIDTMGEYAVPELYKTPGESGELGNIEDLVSGAFRPLPEGVDRNEEEGYNRGNVRNVPERGGGYSETRNQGNIEFQDMFQDLFQDTEAFEGSNQETPRDDKPVFTPSFGDDSEGLGGLPDLDSMAVAFGGGTELRSGSSGLSFGGAEEDAPAVDTESSRHTGSKPQPIKGDFNPKELANGIRTVLKKENR
jgi:hypothetical protein